MKEPLPVNIFKNLEAGKKQTVVVYGTSLSHTAVWPQTLQEYFDTQFPGLVIVINSAMSGQHSNWGVAEFQERVLSKNPSLVFIEFSMNDAATKHNISLEQAIANLDIMVEALRRWNPHMDIMLQTMNTVWDAPDEPQGKKSASDRPNLAAYYGAYRQYAYEHNLLLIDHHQNWLQLQQQNEAQFRQWLPDGCHPIHAASLAVTWPAIQALLKKARVAAVPR